MARLVSRRVHTADPAPRPVPLREFAVSGYIAVVLASEAEIREEWCGMRNCALEHVAGARSGTHCVISLRDRETGERVVTIVLEREHGLYVARDARRRFNRPADPELWLVARRAAAICNGACETQSMRQRERPRDRNQLHFGAAW